MTLPNPTGMLRGFTCVLVHIQFCRRAEHVNGDSAAGGVAAAGEPGTRHTYVAVSPCAGSAVDRHNLTARDCMQGGDPTQHRSSHPCLISNDSLRMTLSNPLPTLSHNNICEHRNRMQFVACVQALVATSIRVG